MNIIYTFFIFINLITALPAKPKQQKGKVVLPGALAV